MAKKVTGDYPYSNVEEYKKKWRSLDYVGENYNSLTSLPNNHLLYGETKLGRKKAFFSFVLDKYRKEIKDFEDKLTKHGIILELYQTTGQLDADGLIKLNDDLKQLLEDYENLGNNYAYLESIVVDVLGEQYKQKTLIPSGKDYEDLRTLGKRHIEVSDELKERKADITILEFEKKELIKNKEKLIETNKKQLELIKDLRTQLDNSQLENKKRQTKIEETNLKLSKMGWNLINLETAAKELVGKKLELPVFKEQFAQLKPLFLDAKLIRVWEFIEENFKTLFSVMDMLNEEEEVGREREREREQTSEERYETADEGEDDGDNGQTGEHDSNKGGTCSIS